MIRTKTTRRIKHGYVFLQGQSIPAGTMVNADIHHVMAHDPLFVEPEKFAPDRYISEDGKTLKKVRTRIIFFYLRCCFSRT